MAGIYAGYTLPSETAPQKFHRFTEYLKLEATHKDHQASCSLQDFLTLNRMAKSIIQTLLEL